MNKTQIGLPKEDRFFNYKIAKPLKYIAYVPLPIDNGSSF